MTEWLVGVAGQTYQSERVGGGSGRADLWDRVGGRGWCGRVALSR